MADGRHPVGRAGRLGGRRVPARRRDGDRRPTRAAPGCRGILVVAIAGLVGYVLVRRSLRPLDEMAGTAHAIADGDLSLRVPASPTTTEVDQLAESFNAMVTRIEQSFDAQRASEAEARASEERMRRFVADAGHELRTPLTSIRGYAELIEQGAAADPDAALARIQDEAIGWAGSSTTCSCSLGWTSSDH